MLLPYYIYRADAKHHEGDSDDDGCKVTQLCAEYKRLGLEIRGQCHTSRHDSLCHRWCSQA